MNQTKDYTIMTYNIQSCKDYINKNFNPLIPARVINQFKPDIICLNEVRNGSPSSNKDWSNQVKDIAELIGYNYYYFGKAIDFKSGEYGNAIISKYKINDINVIKIPDPLIKNEDAYYETRSIITCKIQELTVITTHIGLANAEKENAVTELTKIINQVEQPLILMGDFNMEPNNPIKKPIDDLLFDVSLKKDKPEPSFPSINPRIKIDYIYVSKNIKVIDTTIPNIVASDHLPILSKLKVFIN